MIERKQKGNIKDLTLQSIRGRKTDSCCISKLQCRQRLGYLVAQKMTSCRDFKILFGKNQFLPYFSTLFQTFIKINTIYYGEFYLA